MLNPANRVRGDCRRTTRPARAHSEQHSRRGLSLVELLAVFVVLGVVGGAIARVLILHQRRFATLAWTSLEQRRLREGASLLVTALRDVAPFEGDLSDGELTHASLALRVTVASFVLCDSPAAGASTIDVASLSGDPGFWPGDSADIGDVWGPPPATPGEWTAGGTPPSPPVAGDSAFIYDAGPRLDAADDRWTRHLVTDAAPIAGCAVRGAHSYRLTLSPPPAAVDAHAVATIFRRTRFALYQAADGAWYLGATDCSAARTPPCPPMQPASGPYAPLAPSTDTARGGLHLTYLDSAGAPTTESDRVAQIRIRLRSAPSAQHANVAHELSIVANLRNRSR